MATASIANATSFLSPANRVRPANRYFVEREKMRDGEALSVRIHITRASTRRRWKKTNATVSQEFVPLRRSDRFVIIEGTWSYFPGRSSGPEHPLDIKRGFQGGTELYGDGADVWMDRTDGLRQVAARNRDAMASVRECPKRDHYIAEWSVLVEVGQGVAPLRHFDLSRSGIGDVREHSASPIRLVVPTAEECARFCRA